MSLLDNLRDFVSIESVSGNEAALVSLVAKLLENGGVTPSICGRNVWARKGSGTKTLLLNAHLDTVPPTKSWTRNPFQVAIEDGKLYGLGANDDKGPLAALLEAFLTIDESTLDGVLLFSGTCDEEIGGAGLEMLIKTVPAPSAIIIGEPTHLKVCTAQKGQVRVSLLAKGVASHAARPVKGNNAIVNAARDIVALDNLQFEEADDMLGYPTISCTIINGGVKSNVIPDSCEVVCDARTTRAYDNSRLLEIIKNTCKSQISVRSTRIIPRVTTADELIVQACLKGAGQKTPEAFGGISELFCAPNIPGVVLGPGLPKMSHAVDEYIEIEQVEKAVDIYRAIIRQYLKGD